MIINTFVGKYTVKDDRDLAFSIPYHFPIDSSDLEIDMTDEELAAYYRDRAEEHFLETVVPKLMSTDLFVAWAREQLNNRKE